MRHRSLFVFFFSDKDGMSQTEREELCTQRNGVLLWTLR